MQIVLSSDHQLRQNLLELLDHKVIIDRTDERKNKKIYIMKYEKRTLEKLIDLKIDWMISTPFTTFTTHKKLAYTSYWYYQKENLHDFWQEAIIFSLNDVIASLNLALLVLLIICNNLMQEKLPRLF